MATRALVHLPRSVRSGDIVEVRATLAHPMETGYRRDSDGSLLPRNVVTRMECRHAGELVFAADTFPAIAANPYISFSFVATASGPVEISWTGDNGFAHKETVNLQVT